MHGRRQPCVYRAPGQDEVFKRKHHELQRTSKDMYQLLELLRTAPDQAATAILHNLRGEGSVAEILDAVGSGKLIRAATSIPKAPPIAPTYSTMESYLNSHCAGAFPPLMPLEAASVNLRLLGLGN